MELHFHLCYTSENGYFITSANLKTCHWYTQIFQETAFILWWETSISTQVSDEYDIKHVPNIGTFWTLYVAQCFTDVCQLGKSAILALHNGSPWFAFSQP